jgi:hypothetical protein
LRDSSVGWNGGSRHADDRVRGPLDAHAVDIDDDDVERRVLLPRNRKT